MNALAVAMRRLVLQNEDFNMYSSTVIRFGAFSGVQLKNDRKTNTTLIKGFDFNKLQINHVKKHQKIGVKLKITLIALRHIDTLLPRKKIHKPPGLAVLACPHRPYVHTFSALDASSKDKKTRAGDVLCGTDSFER